MSRTASAYWLESQREGLQDAPDVRVLWNRTPVARKPYRCDHCGDPIAAGDRYESTGSVEDGVFHHQRLHRWAYQYPSGCPAIGVRDKVEAEAQFVKDGRPS